MELIHENYCSIMLLKFSRKKKKKIAVQISALTAFLRNQLYSGLTLPQSMTQEPPFFEFLQLTPLRRGPYPTTGNTGLPCPGELFIESVVIFLPRISIVFLLQAGSPPKHTPAKFKKCYVSIKIQAFGDWHSWDRTVISLKSSAMCHCHTGLVLHVGHSELANFLFLSLDKTCQEWLRDAYRDNLCLFWSPNYSGQSFFPRMDNRQLRNFYHNGYVDVNMRKTRKRYPVLI